MVCSVWHHHGYEHELHHVTYTIHRNTVDRHITQHVPFIDKHQVELLDVTIHQMDPSHYMYHSLLKTCIYIYHSPHNTRWSYYVLHEMGEYYIHHTPSNVSGSLLIPSVALPLREHLHVGGISILAATHALHLSCALVLASNSYTLSASQWHCPHYT